MAEQEEVKIELEAVQAVYGDDCVVLDSFPPHLRVHIKPRTADVSSQQFVEAVIRIQGGPQYPKQPPDIDLIEFKGLDEQRQKHLISCVEDKACELSTCLMLVALCEEAVETLSAMNHPDGDCPLCLYPLVPEDEQQNKTLPFMKLMSCFHCFHSECIISWWNWHQSEKEPNTKNSSTATVRPIRDPGIHNDGVMEESMGFCPVCRKVFHAKDIEHVLDLVDTHYPQLNFDGTEVDEKLLQSDFENIRRRKFEAALKLQEENGGLIEPQRNLAVLPGMFRPQPVMQNDTVTLPNSTVTLPNSTSSKETTEQKERNLTISSGTNSSGSSNRHSTSERWDSGIRKQRVRNSRKPVKQWVRKDNGSAD